MPLDRDAVMPGLVKAGWEVVWTHIAHSFFISDSSLFETEKDVMKPLYQEKVGEVTLLLGG